MYKTALYMVAILLIITLANTYQIIVYRQLVPVLAWSNDTLRLNVIVNRDMWKACKRFRWCDERHAVPKWPVVWQGEVRFLA